MPTDEGFGRHDGQGVSRVEASAEPHEGQAGGIVESARPDFAFLIEGELFAQEEILGGKRGLERKPRARNQSRSPNRLNQLRQSLIIGRHPLFSISSLKLVAILWVSSQSGNFCGAQR